MKLYTLKVLCRGCQAEIPTNFQARKSFCEVFYEAVCPECESQLEIQVAQGLMKKQILTRVRMVKHTEKLLGILESRRASA